ncbi:hypothetical protein RhiirC2_755535 [Rhizophagus irregularis]|uniref:Uncharacterized protein n=1 Tax=Rhizophagus irregularis TaxID=588596 RepID=A0A2N1MLC3_9GLOM|nr:hypothetical protein RhiirC2_763537 [Rhizophagus irregularis]PKK62416.1 hypothetical protein RhiirC2_759612 [Rhizophagus irregularis]PKK65136.1 hypothetical protein RhiirC2_755535 [Rhizophagus irregularis]
MLSASTTLTHVLNVYTSGMEHSSRVYISFFKTKIKHNPTRLYEWRVQAVPIVLHIHTLEWRV